MNKQPTIVISRQVGRLGNRLMIFSQMIALAHEYGCRVVNTAFNEYAHLFRGTSHDLYCRYPAQPQTEAPSSARRRLLYHTMYVAIRCLIHARLTRWPVHVLRLEHRDMMRLNAELLETYGNRKYVFLQGYAFHAHAALTRNLDIVREFFRPIEKYERVIDNALSKARQDVDVLIGVHIRHGDYKEYLHGKLYFELEHYIKVMQEVAAQFGSKRVRFIVCSDSAFTPDQFKPLDVHMGPGEALTDMYALAGCDLIIGPLSTFSGWASIYGDVKLLGLYKKDQSTTLDQFRLYHADWFEEPESDDLQVHPVKHLPDDA